jgi:hypothetical protein
LPVFVGNTLQIYPEKRGSMQDIVLKAKGKSKKVKGLKG